jgi:hypothetical protein
MGGNLRCQRLQGIVASGAVIERRRAARVGTVEQAAAPGEQDVNDEPQQGPLRPLRQQARGNNGAQHAVGAQVMNAAIADDADDGRNRREVRQQPEFHDQRQVIVEGSACAVRRPATLKRSAVIALVVGTILAAIDQGVLPAGELTLRNHPPSPGREAA